MRTDRPTQVLRNRANFFSGLAVSFGLLSAMVWTDPYGVVRDREPPSDLAFEVQFLLGLTVISLGAYAFGVRPRLELWPDKVVLRNVLRDVTIPHGRIEEVDPDSGVYLRLRADGRTFTALGLEKHKFQLVRNVTGVAGQASAEIRRMQEATSPMASGQVEVKLRLPSLGEAVLALAWASCIAAAAWALGGR